MAEIQVTVEGDRIETRELPLLDLAPYRAGDKAAKQALAGELRDACEQVGFLALKNHGISDRLLARTIEQNKRFCALPPEQKLEIKIDRDHGAGQNSALAPPALSR